jgi:subtilisin family serine protease
LLTSSGVISLDPNVIIIPVKIFTNTGGGNVDLSRLTDAFDFAWTQGADVLSNSWGFRNPDYPEIPDLNAAIQRASVQGRGGKGSPVIFSSGNTDPGYPDPSKVRYLARLSYCFAVGAIQMNDIRWGYSCYGPQLDMVAPSSDGATVPVWGLDQMSNLGVNPNAMTDCPPLANDQDYYCHFGGTSASCPVVAGVAALLISRNSTLTKDQIYNILDSSAVTSLDWGTITPPDLQYGWGRVDAFRAILSISRGDANNDGFNGNILDLNYMTADIFQGGPDPFPSPKLGDCNCDGTYNIVDLNYMVNRIFRGGPPPVNPCYKF